MPDSKNTTDLTGRLARPLDLAARNVRAATAVAKARPAYAAGFRAALATVVPLLVAQVFHLSGGTWMSLAGFSGALADKGGAYDSRAVTIASLTAFGAIAVFVGGGASHTLTTAVVLTFAVALALQRAHRRIAGRKHRARIIRARPIPVCLRVKRMHLHDKQASCNRGDAKACPEFFADDARSEHAVTTFSGMNCAVGFGEGSIQLSC